MKSVVDMYNVTTFNELYLSMISAYPNLKTNIDGVFKQYYIPVGNEDGNIIIYQ